MFKDINVNELNKFERLFYTFILYLIILTSGVQIGIYHGRKLERQEIFNDYRTTNTQDQNFSQVNRP